ncbi:D-altronate dehydratase [Marinilabilia salmonicolor]|jgi:altronate hydrolase|uniref:UxaA family hydrolase n=1 Tax=Marinilabilia salmonicolor TaxID=989 RepID=UPI000D05D509|nr:altronate dehydratase family protein [Marinilabilia salmonicolor]PRZ00861.1 D-altronate dehydratase [Marinilabilia salmonicolor]
MRKLLKIDARDNVAVALDNLSAGFAIDQEDLSVTILTDVSQAQKVALSDIAKGENIIKYGQPIGHATSPIPKGEKVDETNIKTNLEGVLEYNYSPEFTPNQYRNRDLTFKGFRRKNGDVGIRNELWIVPTVGCVNGIGEQMLNALKREVDISRIDGIEIFKHNYGCSQLGDDHENTKKILRDIVLHPNAGGVLVLGLGCENNQPDVFREFLGDFDEERIKFLVTQDVKNEHEEGLKILKELYEKMAEDVREEIPLSELKVGLKCGGSDGFSGISANPLLGAFSDFLVAQGGTTVLTEVPEMFGAETLLMNRAENRDVFEKTVHLINDFKNYFIENKQPIYENPSPGNKAGGISTLEEKSLGCTQKCGTDKVRDVLKYGERLTTKGLNLLSSPGNDLVAATALGAAGCHLVLFTTGRGTPFGSFVPTMKISTNTPLFEKKPHWIDFNAGPIADGKQIEDVLEEFIPYLIDVASGNQVNNEKYGFREIAIFKTGVTL